MRTLNDVLAVADAAYGDGLVAGTKGGKKDVGDTLALFIARELKDVFDEGASDRANVAEAVSAMERARAQLEAVKLAIKTMPVK